MKDSCSKLIYSLEKAWKIIEAAEQLHNFIIDTQQPDVDNKNIDRINDEDINLTNEEGDAGFVPTKRLMSIGGTSIFRVELGNFFQQSGISWPGRNLLWQEQELDDEY